MKEYIVSARKYRPMTFDSVVGQAALTTTLKNAVNSGKLAHAYLFCGPRGVGKTTCARIFAKAINCESPTEDGEACNHCESCQAFNEQRSYNIFELDAASNNSVENIKSLMEQTRIPPQVGKYKVFIIDEVHMLSTAAFNAFLKTLEEPPAHVIFILATTEKHKILPTIISRCQIYDFERMTVPNIVNHLKMVADKEGIAYEEEALAVIAEKADGGMRDALSIFDQTASFCQGNITYQKVIEDLNVLDSENYFNIVELSLQNKVPEVMVLLNNIISKGFDGGLLVGGLAKHIRNVLMARDEQTLPLLEVSQRQQERYREQAQKCPTNFLYQALKLCNQCDINYRQSSNKRLLVELTLIQIGQLTQEDDTPAAGRSPKRLKSLFRKLISNVQTKAASQGAAGRSVRAGRDVATTPAPLSAGAATDTTAEKTPDVASPHAAPVRKPALKLANIGLTFARMRQNAEETPEQKEEPEVKDIAKKKDFDEEQLRTQWLAMCNRMPQAMVGLAARMKNMVPTITDYPAVEVVVENKILLEQMVGIKNKIRNTLIRDLQNADIQLTLRLAETSELTKVLNNREMFEEMSRKNPALQTLTNSLDLVLA
ncbi:MAG: DNA polymerase III subunit gamma/tau [Prevotella sp.]|nr:DNA polymerase III subunit gamma/tau [Prevotella sp.]